MSRRPLTFEREGADHGELLAAIATFAGDDLVPDGVSFEIVCLDPGDAYVEIGPPPRPYWFVRGPAHRDDRIVEDAVISVVETLPPTHDIVAAIVEEALAQDAPGLTHLCDLRWEGGPIALRATHRFGLATLEIECLELDAWSAYSAAVARLAARWTAGPPARL